MRKPEVVPELQVENLEQSKRDRATFKELNGSI